MIIDLNQILSIFNIDYEIVKENNKLGGASLPKQFNQGGEIRAQFLSRKFSLIYDPDKIKPEWDQVGHKKYAMLFMEDNLGVIYQKTGFTSQSGYFVLKYDNVKYKMYKVGLETGYVYPIYDGSTLVACIVADKSIFNELNLYHIYASSKSYAYIATVFGLYLDACIQLKHGPLITSPSFISGKSLRKKYDPAFIEKIKDMENKA
ncbi:hypothetical protein DW257_05340 [Catenibacterium sp. AM22-15]|uniref:hypothetical protein n=1 Tax=unclassified Catenibacterium TaxID=2643636 RepID=UPI000E3F5F29|nr:MULTISPECIES: hypothetical protein [unclassified Catenibacterium]RGE97932.1 hypothetical protein DW269_05905 [Catenibacterium sp. AM22-6LB]RGF06505.1 hypothetical protein DW257_05340 [Catenibacterium sp. AM22-15]